MKADLQDLRPVANGIPALIAVALLGIATSFAIFLFVRNLEHSRAEAHFQQIAGQRLDPVRNNVIGSSRHHQLGSQPF